MVSAVCCKSNKQQGCEWFKLFAVSIMCNVPFLDISVLWPAKSVFFFFFFKGFYCKYLSMKSCNGCINPEHTFHSLMIMSCNYFIIFKHIYLMSMQL